MYIKHLRCHTFTLDHCSKIQQTLLSTLEYYPRLRSQKAIETSQIRSCLINLEKAQRSPLDKLFMHDGQHQLSIETLKVQVD